MMANVPPRRFVRVPPPAADGDPGPMLREAFEIREQRLPDWLTRLLARLGVKRP
ncbi:MAG TPA: hypothetical protein VEZ70_13395 [Allosphingosinicella sp.]|jgi:hypothetical protein|nr:hypothetical protein [Allosphingosinicella sp.]